MTDFLGYHYDEKNGKQGTDYQFWKSWSVWINTFGK